MILGGDEILRTQQGNNNAYCQDNEISWYNWEMLQKNGDIFRFVKQMIAFRKRHPSLMRIRFLTGRKQRGRSLPDVSWHGTKLHKPMWQDPDARVLAFTLGALEEGEEDIHVILNMSESEEMFSLPRRSERSWHVTVDTGRASPFDIHEQNGRPPVNGYRYLAAPRSVVVLESLPVS